MRALEAALNAVWAMETNALETLLTIAAREHETPTPEVLEAYRAKTLANAEVATVRDGVAIISLNGPMIKRGNFFSAMSGATSYDVIARDLTTARTDPKVKAGILLMDTPGGEANGAGELAAMVKAFAAEKPIIAYVGGMAASAGYWIASAATEIVVDPSAMLGSIGAQVALGKRDDPKGVTTYKFVSSQSPMKNADPGTDEGAAHMQGIVDAMAQVFVEDVARNRGVAISTVLSDFGKGGIFVGQDAVKAGLADSTGNFEGVLAELSGKRSGPSKGTTTMSGAGMSNSDAELDRIVAASVAKAMATSTAPAAATYSHADVERATAEAVAKAMAGHVGAGAALAHQGAIISAAEAEELERDAYVSRITGEPLPQITAVRHARERDVESAAAAQAAVARDKAADQAELDAWVARISAA